MIHGHNTNIYVLKKTKSITMVSKQMNTIRDVSKNWKKLTEYFCDSYHVAMNAVLSYLYVFYASFLLLYVMPVTLSFFSTSETGLALKIIKGRYPPIHSRYSPNLRDLIQRMLSTVSSTYNMYISYMVRFSLALSPPPLA